MKTLDSRQFIFRLKKKKQTATYDFTIFLNILYTPPKNEQINITEKPINSLITDSKDELQQGEQTQSFCFRKQIKISCNRLKNLLIAVNFRLKIVS